MSAAVLGMGAEPKTQKLGSGRFNDSGLRVDVEFADAPITRRSSEGSRQGLCYESASEEDLVLAARSGDQRAFLELCRRYRTSLERRIRRIVRNVEDTEDVHQETLMSAFRHLAGFRAKCSFRTWILTIATNHSLMLLRKRRSHPQTELGIVTAEGKEVETLRIFDPMPNPEQAYAKRQSNENISKAVRMLSPGFRMIVERYYQDEVKLVDAANAMGITAAAAKSRLLRARIALRRHLNNKRQYLD